MESLFFEFKNWLDINGYSDELNEKLFRIDELRFKDLQYAASNSPMRDVGRDSNYIIACALEKKLDCKMKVYPPGSPEDLKGNDAVFLDGPYAGKNVQIQRKMGYNSKDDFSMSLSSKTEYIEDLFDKNILDIIDNSKHDTKWHQQTELFAMLNADDTKIYIANFSDLKKVVEEGLHKWENNYENLLVLQIRFRHYLDSKKGDDGEFTESPDDVFEAYGDVKVRLRVKVTDQNGNAKILNKQVDPILITKNSNETEENIRTQIEKVTGKDSLEVVKELHAPLNVRKFLIKFKNNVDVEPDQHVWQSNLYDDTTSDNFPKGRKISTIATFEKPTGKGATFRGEYSTFVDPDTGVTVRISRSTSTIRGKNTDVWGPIVYIPASSVPTKIIDVTYEELEDCKKRRPAAKAPVKKAPVAKVIAKPQQPVLPLQKSETEIVLDKLNSGEPEATIEIKVTRPDKVAEKAKELRKFGNMNGLVTSFSADGKIATFKKKV
jgi:hypothetical protein